MGGGGGVAAGGEGAAMAAGAAEGGAAAEAGGAATQNTFMWTGTMLFRRGMQALGAITGGLVGDGLYGG